MKKLLVLDGHSIAFRAFYALREADFRAPDGQATGAVHGFLNMLLKMLTDEEPTHVAVAFDLGRESFRTEEYADYKGGRRETPEDFIGQVPLIQQVLRLMNIQVLTKENFEADDIIATLATLAPKQGFQVAVASGDRDSFQLIGDDVYVIWPGQSPTDVRHMDAQAVVDKYGVTPELYPHLAALVGESADNLPGVPGVGAKTAAGWLAKYGDLDSLLEHADEIGGKRGQALRDHMDDVRRNRRLNALVTDLDLGVEPDDLTIGPFDRVGLADVFKQLGFGRLATRILSIAGRYSDGSEGVAAYSDLEDFGAADEAEPKFAPFSFDGMQILTQSSAPGGVEGWLDRTKGRVAVYPVGESALARVSLDWLCLAAGGEVLSLDPAFLTDPERTAVARLLADPDRTLFFSWKTACHLLGAAGFEDPALGADVSLASYVMDPGQHSDDLAKLIKSVLEADATEKLPRKEPDRTQAQRRIDARCAFALHALWERLQPTGRLAALLADLERPIASVLLGMERAGIAVDGGELEGADADLEHLVQRAQERAWESIGGQQVNLSSPKALQKVLFEDLGMPPTRKTKTGFTTNAAALVELYERTDHPFLEALLEHRDKLKLQQTVKGLHREVAPDGRIHTTFQQTVTATGRLSSTDPNLQNIPARTEEGQRLREAFVPGPGAEGLLTADYSQIEMRIMAHSSGDAKLIEAFNEGEDVHATMAALVFGVKPSEVSGAQRSKIKAMSYGLVYGLSAFGLSKQLRISVGEAKDLMDVYFHRFGAVKDYLDGLVVAARQVGYTETMFGRRRYLPDLHSSNRVVRQVAERAALNAPIQGSAADIIKFAMLAAARQLAESDLKSRMLLQVHDELVFEVAPGEREPLSALVEDAMRGAAKLSVPLSVSVGFGANWRAAAH